MRIKITPKWGEYYIDIPSGSSVDGSLNTELFQKKVTIYNDVPAKEKVGEPRRFDKYVVDLCNIQGGFVQRSDGTIQNIINAKTVITKDLSSYLSPHDYYDLPIADKDNYYTVQVGDFVVFGEVSDIVTDGQEFSKLQQKYKNNGFKVVSVSENIFGMSVDNVTFSNV